MDRILRGSDELREVSVGGDDCYPLENGEWHLHSHAMFATLARERADLHENGENGISNSTTRSQRNGRRTTSHSP